MSSPDLIDLITALEAELSAPAVDDVPDGWLTAQGWADLRGVSRPHTSRLLKTGVDAGRVEVRKFRVTTSGRGVYPTQHYRIVAAG